MRPGLVRRSDAARKCISSGSIPQGPVISSEVKVAVARVRPLTRARIHALIRSGMRADTNWAKESAAARLTPGQSLLMGLFDGPLIDWICH